jgi:hypothetical protein
MKAMFMLWVSRGTFRGKLNSVENGWVEGEGAEGRKEL